MIILLGASELLMCLSCRVGVSDDTGALGTEVHAVSKYADNYYLPGPEVSRVKYLVLK